MSNYFHIAAAQPFGSTLASRILHDAKAQRPDLENVLVFLPNALAARQLRRALIDQNNAAMIGPGISSMSQWLNNHVPLADANIAQLNQSGRQLILFEALKQHQQLFNENNLWQICNSLLQFFDELSQNNFQLTDYSDEQWQNRLQHAYGFKPDNKRDSNHLFYEARIVYTLWQAWQQQTRAMNLLDANSSYQLRLQQIPDNLHTDITLYIVGFEQLTLAEQQWCHRQESRHKIIYVTQSDEITTDANQLIHNALNTSQTLHQHIDQTKQKSLAPANNSLSLYAAQSAETEARAIHLQTRCWLAENKRHIAIISENRKLMRRVRALMERSGIVVEDTAGWSIATTSAAAVLERWLQCIEQDFAWQPLLDLLKSPFFCEAEQRNEHLKHVFRLEQDIIIHERITADLDRYQKTLQQRHTRLPHWQDNTFTALQQLLAQLGKASIALRKTCTSGKLSATNDHINALLTSLDALGITAQLKQDAAGILVLAEIQKMQQSAESIPSKMNWHDFRTWLGATLEQQPFTPKNKPSTVHLLNLKQAEYCEFDAVIIASANADTIPGKPTQTPFFNQSVRRALALKTWSNEKDESFLRFKHLIQAAPRTLISYQSELDGEWLQPSPWVQSIDDHARLIENTNLHNTPLDALLHIEETSTSVLHEFAQQQTQPSPTIAPELQPERWSVSSYQRMVDCPYKFFASDVLALKAEDTITQELLRSEYGEKIHQTLRAFFEQCPHLPPPFDHPVTAHNRQQAIHHLIIIAQQIFSRDMEDNVQHQGWMQQWCATAETFIDWLIERQLNWQFDQAEVSTQREIDELTQLHGRLDLVEKNNNGHAIIDYKTGASPKKKDVLQGENVQLTAYALLMNNIKQVAFLKLDKNETKFSADIKDEELNSLATMNFARLQELAKNIRDGQGLTAWGDTQTCQYCELGGLCRKQIWQSAS